MPVAGRIFLNPRTIPQLDVETVVALAELGTALVKSTAESGTAAPEWWQGMRRKRVA
jgi:hypothetical protein